MDIKLKCANGRQVSVEVIEKDGGLVLRAGKLHDFVKVWVDESGTPRVAIADIDVGNVTYSPKEGHDILNLCWAR